MQKILFVGAAVLFAAWAPFACAQDAYPDFEQFCLDNFGAEHDDLVYQMFGADLEYKESGFWIHESRNSASIGFATNLPAKSYIEYGETDSYGQQTAQTTRYYYQHLHYPTGLQPSRTYHYRFVAIDERGNRVDSPDRIFTTPSLSSAIEVPGALSGPPYVLDQEGAYYLLTQDISANTRGITIQAENITLDLNGFSIVYDQGTPIVSGAWNDYLYSEDSTTGIHMSIYNVDGATRILNGVVRQGANNGQGNIGIGFNPVLIRGGDAEIAGLTVEYSGHSVGGIGNHWGVLDAHHNVLIDRGTGIDNRHMGIQALWAGTIHANGIRHNVLRRVRHQGIVVTDPDGKIFSNEIYQDSWDTNAFGLRPSKEVYSNKLFGTGYHVNAISWADGIHIHDNFVHLQGVAPTTRSDEYGAMCSVNGFRLTQYGGGTKSYRNNLYEGNTIIVKGREGCGTMRGVQFSSDPYVENLRFRNNTIKTEVQDELTSIAPCVVAHGLSDRADAQLPIVYENNHLISNSVHIRFGDDYAIGGNHQFKNNTLTKFGNRSHYRTVQIGYWVGHTYNNLFVDTVLEGGADLEDNEFSGSGRRNYSVAHSLWIIAKVKGGNIVVNQQIAVIDSTGQTYMVTTDTQGRAKLEFVEYTYEALEGASSAAKTVHSAHEVRIDGFLPFTISNELFSIRNTSGSPELVEFTLDDPNATIPASPMNLRVVPN